MRATRPCRSFPARRSPPCALGPTSAQHPCRRPAFRATLRAGRARVLGAALGYAGVIALNVDTEDASHLAAIRETVPPSPVAKTGAKGFTAFHRAPPGASISSRHYAHALKRGIADLLSAGTQTVLPPSPPPAGHAYRWLTADTLLTVPAHDLPQAPADIAERLDNAVAPWRRLTAFAKAGLARRARELASTAEGGRNNALFALGAGLGRYVFHGVLRLDALETAPIAACEANGLMREDGRLAVLATLHKGVARAKDDPLPVLKERKSPCVGHGLKSK